MAGNTVRIRAVLDDKVSSGLDKIRARFDTLGKSKGAQSVLQGVGIGAGINAFNALGTVIGSVTDYIGESIKAASDLHESMSKSEVVFGSASRAVEEFGTNAADSIGLSKQAAIEAAATLGNLFTGIGQTKTAAAGMSTAMVQLAGDLASFNNIDPTDALEKLRSGLSGESEPLRSVGVFLTEAKVKAKAMQMGLGDAHHELSEGQKVLARYQIILDETGNAQGDFARTSDGLANSTRKVAAEQANLSAKLGEEAAPLALLGTQLQLNFVRGVTVAGDAIGQAFDRIGMSLSGLNADQIKAREEAAKTGVRFGKLADDVTSAVQEAARQPDLIANAMTGTEHRVKTSSKLIADHLQAMTDIIVSAAEEAIGQAFDPLIAKQEALANLSELAAARRTIASKKASKEEKAAARSTILSLEQTNAEYLVKLAKAGQAGSTAYKKGIAELKGEIKNASGPTKKALQDVLDKIHQIEKDGKVIPINFVLSAEGSGLSPGHKAAGGPASGLTWVGERGPELLNLPNGSYVNDHGSSMAMAGSRGGGGMTVNFNSLWPPTREQAREVARVVDQAHALTLQRAAPTAART